MAGGGGGGGGGAGGQTVAFAKSHLAVFEPGD